MAWRRNGLGKIWCVAEACLAISGLAGGAVAIISDFLRVADFSGSATLTAFGSYLGYWACTMAGAVTFLIAAGRAALRRGVPEMDWLGLRVTLLAWLCGIVAWFVLLIRSRW